MALGWGVSAGLCDKMGGGMLFIHSSIDDAGLDAASFRILCHLARRAGQDAAAFPSLKSMARTCRLNVKTVARRIRRLVEAGLVVRVRRPGLSTRYELRLQSSRSASVSSAQAGLAEAGSTREVHWSAEPMAENRAKGGGNADVARDAKRANEVSRPGGTYDGVERRSVIGSSAKTLGFEEAVEMFEREFPHIAVRASLAKMVGKPFRRVLTVANCREWLRRERQARFVPKIALAKVNAASPQMSDEEWNQQSQEARPMFDELRRRLRNE